MRADQLRSDSPERSRRLDGDGRRRIARGAVSDAGPGMRDEGSYSTRLRVRGSAFGADGEAAAAAALGVSRQEFGALGRRERAQLARAIAGIGVTGGAEVLDDDSDGDADGVSVWGGEVCRRGIDAVSGGEDAPVAVRGAGAARRGSARVALALGYLDPDGDGDADSVGSDVGNLVDEWAWRASRDEGAAGAEGVAGIEAEGRIGDAAARRDAGARYLRSLREGAAVGVSGGAGEVAGGRVSDVGAVGSGGAEPVATPVAQGQGAVAEVAAAMPAEGALASEARRFSMGVAASGNGSVGSKAIGQLRRNAARMVARRRAAVRTALGYKAESAGAARGMLRGSAGRSVAAAAPAAGAGGGGAALAGGGLLAVVVVVAALLLVILCGVGGNAIARQGDGSNQSIADAALAEFDYVQSHFSASSPETDIAERYTDFVGISSSLPWCACFASYCIDQAGVRELLGLGSSAWHDYWVTACKADATLGTVHKNDGSYVPRPGDLAILCDKGDSPACPDDYDWNDYGGQHVTIVVDVSEDGRTFTTVGGNESDTVSKTKWQLQYSSFDWFVTLAGGEGKADGKKEES